MNQAINQDESMNEDVLLSNQSNESPKQNHHAGCKRRRQSNNSSNNNNKDPTKRSRVNSPLVDKFFQAIENGDYPTVVRMFIHKEIVGNETTQYDESAVDLAIHKIHCHRESPYVVMNLFRIINILLEYQPALLNQQTNVHEMTPLFWAMITRNLQLVRFLLERGADESIPGRWGDTFETPLQRLDGIWLTVAEPNLVSLFRRARSIRNIGKLKRGFPKLREAMRLRPQKRLIVKRALDASSIIYIPEVLIDIMIEYLPLVENAEK